MMLNQTPTDGQVSASQQEQRKRLMKKILISLGTLAALTTGAEAHIGHGHTAGFIDGFMHPIGGMDHVLAMVAVGLFASILGGRARWAVPLSFVGMMAIGGGLGIAGLHVPFVEVGIALSVLVLGTLIAVQKKLPVVLASALVGVFAVFHGVAHGAEMPVDASGVQYALGFIVATATLHGVGLGLGFGMSRFAKFSGVAIAAAGLGLVAGWL
jgi:urease accessory protein